MLKLIGAVMIIFGGGFWGISQSAALKKRKDTIEALITALSLLETEISYGKRDIKKILKGIGIAQNLWIFTNISDQLYEMSLSEAFNAAVKNRDTYLSVEDKDILLTMAENLGKTDTQNQFKCISYTKKRLEAARLCAAEDCAGKGHLYRGAGILIGSMAAIILF